jgi:hypothetical protein
MRIEGSAIDNDGVTLKGRYVVWVKEVIKELLGM